MTAEPWRRPGAHRARRTLPTALLPVLVLGAALAGHAARALAPLVGSGALAGACLIGAAAGMTAALWVLAHLP